MKVYTKKGDKGTTQLIGGTRIPKNSLRIEAYGTIDELNSYIGLIRDQNINQKYVDQLIETQDRLFTLGSLLAADPEKSTMKLPELQETDVTNLENWIDEMDAELDPMTSFVLPGGHTTVSFTHIARCVCRRSERVITELSLNDKVSALVLAYVNRLSDYLFVLGRKLTKDLDAKEQPWQPRM
jgi:cob(I)alamin adenosyltransferase